MMLFPECDCPSDRLCTINGDCICDDHHVSTSTMKTRRKRQVKRQVKCLLICFVLTACKLIQTSFRPLVLESERMKVFQLSNLEPSKLHVMKKLNVWVLI